MDRIAAHTTVLLGFGVAASLRLASDVLAGDAPDVGVLASLWVGAIMLSVLAYAAPDLAQPLGALILAVAVIHTGPDVYRKLTEG